MPSPGAGEGLPGRPAAVLPVLARCVSLPLDAADGETDAGDALSASALPDGCTAHAASGVAAASDADAVVVAGSGCCVVVCCGGGCGCGVCWCCGGWCCVCCGCCVCGCVCCGCGWCWCAIAVSSVLSDGSAGAGASGCCLASSPPRLLRSRLRLRARERRLRRLSPSPTPREVRERCRVIVHERGEPSASVILVAILSSSGAGRLRPPSDEQRMCSICRSR